MSLCTLCPRGCAVDREKAEGFCSCRSELLVARAAPHMWEEPCLSGTRGSGAVFFSGCSLKCIFCQNMEISRGKKGAAVTPAQLAELMRRLEGAGVHNINFVTGTHFIPGILKALEIYRPAVPLLWNSGGYEEVSTLKMLDGVIDIYLPDLKHISPRLSKLCCAAPDYAEKAVPAIAEMTRQTGLPVYDEDGIMKKGTLIRHLVLPGCTSDSVKVLQTVAERFPGFPVSLMRQYTPPEGVALPRPLDRRLTEEEYSRVLDCFNALGLSGYCQDAESAQSAYTPPFDLTGVID